MEEMNVENAQSVENKEQPVSYRVTVDTDLSTMLQWDKDGKEIIFDEAVGKFKKLSVEEVKCLSTHNASRYYVAKNMNAELADADDNSSWRNKVKIGGQGTSCMGQLEVKGKRDGYEYYAESSDPNLLQKRLAMGYEIVDSKDEGLGIAGKNTIDVLGNPEHVLMRISKEGHKKVIAARRAKTQKRTFGIMQGTEQDLVDMGLTPHSADGDNQ